MRALTPGGSALKRSQIFRAHFRPSKMHFIAGIPGSTQRLASCGLKHPTVSKVGQRPETEDVMHATTKSYLVNAPWSNQGGWHDRMRRNIEGTNRSTNS